jgi:hypothetical protein
MGVSHRKLPTQCHFQCSQTSSSKKAPSVNILSTFYSALLASTPVTEFSSCRRSILTYLGPPNAAIDGNMDFPDVKTNTMELLKDFVSEGIELQLSGTRLNLLTTE